MKDPLTNKSELPLDKYRNYVINHEVGHSLGLPHATCPHDGQVAPYIGSIMQQMTKGPSHIAPCKENDWLLEIPKDVKLRTHYLGGDDKDTIKTNSMILKVKYIIILLVLIVIIIMILSVSLKHLLYLNVRRVK